MTSSLSPISSDLKANSIASVPLATPMQNFEPINEANSFPMIQPHSLEYNFFS